MNTASNFFSLVKTMHGLNVASAQTQADAQALASGQAVLPLDSDALRSLLMQQLNLKGVDIEVNVQIGVGPVDGQGRYKLVDAVCVHKATPAGQFSFAFIEGRKAPVYVVTGGNGLAPLAQATRDAIVAAVAAD